MTEVKHTSEIVQTSSDEEYALFLIDKQYYVILKKAEDKPEPVRSPGGNIIITEYSELAERLFEEISLHIPTRFVDSVLPWQHMLCDYFSKMKQEEIINGFEECFLQKNDWTFDIAKDDKEWKKIFGEKEKRVADIRNWLKRCTPMQMVAAHFVGQDFGSLNMAYVLSAIMENYKDYNIRKQNIHLSELIFVKTSKWPLCDIQRLFNSYCLFYHYHLQENGPIINDATIGYGS